MNKPIDKKYLVKQLFLFDEQILENKYVNKEESEKIYTHDNKDVLDKLSETSDGQLFFNGNEISMSITVDTEMSDISENAVQNKVIKKYIDDKSVNISADDNNAIKSNEDGIYVKDLSNEVNNISYAQKTVNKKLDYCYLQAEQTYISFKAGMVVPFNILFDSNNVETNSTNNSVKLKANKTYKISCDMFVDQAGYCYIELYDLTNDIVLAGFSKAPSSYNTTSSDSSLQYIYTPKENCEIQIKVKTVNGTIRMYNTLNTAYFIVEEIGQAVTIDPLEYVNESQGIEDTPVGHIIAHMGTNAPKHYLACDGSSVAVADYPYLAQHFKDSFGSEYYFGGSDGTMNLPDLRGEFLRGTGTNSHAEQGNGGEVGEHQDATQVPRTPSFYDSETEKYVYSRELNTEGKNDLVNVDTRKYIPSGGRRYMSHGNGWQQDYHDTEAHEPYAGTVRPTNTSVLYCIKYEPTYFMQNTYNGNVYSTDEQIVGRWIDGKPIYQKTYETVLPETTTGVETIVSIDANTASLDKIIEMSAIASNLTTNVTFSLPWTNSNGTLDKICYEGNDDVFRITNGEPLHNGSPVYITIKYTKTTD